MAEKARTMVLLMSPVSLKTMGKLRRAVPSILLNIARIVEVDEFFWSVYGIYSQ